MGNQNEHYQAIAEQLKEKGYRAFIETESGTGKIRGVGTYCSPILIHEKVLELKELFTETLVFGNTNTQTIHLRIKKTILAPM